MDPDRSAPSRVLAVLSDAVALAGAWIAVVELRGCVVSSALPPLPPEILLPLGWGIVPAVLLARHANRGDPGSRGAVFGVVRDVGLACLAISFLLFLLHVPVNRSVLLGFAALSIPALLASRIVQDRIGRPPGPRPIVVVGEGEARDALLAHLGGRTGIAVVAVLAPDETDALAAQLAGSAEVHVAGVLSAAALGTIARLCDEAGVPLSVDANFLGLRTGSVELRDADGWTALVFRAGSDLDGERLCKRLLDLAGSVVGLVLLAPLVALLALAVRLHDGGPAFFRQQRVGRFGRPFTIHKLRTMVVDAESRPLVGSKPRHDVRITRLGRVLRRLSLDELPQLWNVLRGDMSLVGPRPPLPAEVARYERRQWRRLSVRPGMTGLWQVSGRADLPLERWIELDLQYVDDWSLWLDLRLLARTVPAVIAGTGAR